MPESYDDEQRRMKRASPWLTAAAIALVLAIGIAGTGKGLALATIVGLAALALFAVAWWLGR